ncbi:MAG: NlpC/P60 family protein [Sulfurovaceae bacterium]|nr:NlpC/P60 family protein [Sulfurovaceae bacterium]
MKKTILFTASLMLTSTIFANAENYKIKKGDTLTAIAHKYHIDTAKLRHTNNISLGEKLEIGRKITIPESRYSRRQGFGNNITFNTTHSIIKEKDNFLSDALETASLPFNAQKMLGHRYVWGATGPKTFDCSGFTSFLYRTKGIELPRRAVEQFHKGIAIARAELQKGDLIFFDTSRNEREGVNHVGMYIGDNKFIHASSAKHMVVITSLEHPFYSARFMGARRYV